MAMQDRETVTFRDVRIIFKNLTGEEQKFNREGDRNFSILLGEELAAELLSKGWNVKPLRRQEEDDEQMHQLKVTVSYKMRPPRVWLVSNIDPETGRGRNRTMLAESLVGVLDQLEASRIDLVISAYNWNVNGNVGKKAYLETLFFTMYENELERDYSDIQEMPAVGDTAAPPELTATPHFDYEGEVVNER